MGLCDLWASPTTYEAAGTNRSVSYVLNIIPGASTTSKLQTTTVTLSKNSATSVQSSTSTSNIGSKINSTLSNIEKDAANKGGINIPLVASLIGNILEFGKSAYPKPAKLNVKDVLSNKSNSHLAYYANDSKFNSFTLTPPTQSGILTAQSSAHSSPTVVDEGRKIYQVVFPYQQQKFDEVTLVNGNVISISEIFADGWARGVNLSTGMSGVLPMTSLK
ncbi:hypothetical protein HK096_009467, partial [Nowakowskiella sp. JEL0078]